MTSPLVNVLLVVNVMYAGITRTRSWLTIFELIALTLSQFWIPNVTFVSFMTAKFIVSAVMFTITRLSGANKPIYDLLGFDTAFFHYVHNADPSIRQDVSLKRAPARSSRAPSAMFRQPVGYTLGHYSNVDILQILKVCFAYLTSRNHSQAH